MDCSTETLENLTEIANSRARVLVDVILTEAAYCLSVIVNSFGNKRVDPAISEVNEITLLLRLLG